MSESVIFRAITKKLPRVLREGGLNQYVARTWIYKNICLTVDFSYKDIRFAFNLTPVSEDEVSVDLIKRKHKSNFRVTSDGRDKERIADAVTIDRSLELVSQKAAQVLSEIDIFSGSSIADAKFGIATGPAFPLAARNSKNVGVLTLPLNRNFGGNLQAYALMEVLRQLGHKPVLINRKQAPISATVDTVDMAEDYKKPLITNSIIMNKDFANRAFIEKYILPISRSYIWTEQLVNNVDRYNFDAVIVGSDQVWRPKYAKAILPDFFFEFLSNTEKKLKRISYAASFGTPHWEFDDARTRMARRLVALFSAVSVREDSGVALCKEHLGVEAQHVLDPTLLLSADHYIEKFSLRERRSSDDRLLTYILDVSDDKAQLVEAVSKKLSLIATSTDGQPFGLVGASGGGKSDKSVEGWLASFSEAAFVVTDSFHGVVFSILFNKPFIAYGNPLRGLARFTSVLKLFGLEDRLIVSSDGVDVEKMLSPIDWKSVNSRMEALRASSMQFLQSALSDDGQEGDLPLPASAVADPALPASTLAHGAESPSHICQPLNVLCTGCGVCVSESQGSLAMAWTDDGFLVPRATSAHVPAEAVRVCPFNPHPEDEVKDEDALGNLFLSSAKKYEPRSGHYEAAYIGYSKKYRPTSSSGGMATYVFEKLLERGDVDYLFIVQSDDEVRYKYTVFKNKEDILNISKTRYYPVSLDELFSVIGRTEGRVAVSGVACFIKAIRLKQYYHPELRDKIPFLLGIICGGLKSRRYTDFLAHSAGIPGTYINPEYRVKNPKSTANDYLFAATDEQSRRHEIRMLRVGDMWGTGLFKSRACDFCTDVLTELADISLGDAWLPSYKPDGMGTSVVVTRSALAESIIKSGIEAGDLIFKEVSVNSIVDSQSGGLRHKQGGIKFRMWIAENFLKAPVPVIRARLLKDISIADAFVQILRERARSRSLQFWIETRTSEGFRKRMRSTLGGLKVATKARQNSRSISTPVVRWMVSKVWKRQANFDLLGVALQAEVAKRPRAIGRPPVKEIGRPR